MKLGIFTTIKNPQKRGDNYVDAIRCYLDLADEVVVVNGGKSTKELEIIKKLDTKNKLKIVSNPWPNEFTWDFIGKQFQVGFNACESDVVIRADIDYLFHEKDFDAIRQLALDMVINKIPASAFLKYQFILPDRFNLKSRVVNVINKRHYFDRLFFDSGGDLCQPSLRGIPLIAGRVLESRIPIYNYEKILKTKEQIADDQGRMERAYKAHFSRTQMRTDGSNESAYRAWVKAQQGKMQKPHEFLPLNSHPAYIQDTILNLQPSNWGFSGHNFLEINRYVI